MFSYYRKNKQELIIVMPFPRQRLLLNYFFGYSIGAVLFTVIWVIAWLLNGIFIKNVWNIDSMNMLFVLFLGYGIQGMGEEIICRGYLQGRLTQILSVKLAVILSALFFSCLHLSNDGITVIAFIVLFLFGLIVSIIRYQTNNLWIVGAFHSAWNFIQGPVLGVAVSGSSSDSLVIQSINLPGKEYLSGGEFGLEGSLLSLLFLSISLVFVIIWSKTHIHTSLLKFILLKNKYCWK